jgi:hypothetical protein
MEQGAISPADEEFIATISAWELRGNRWPILGLFASHFVDEIELGRYVKRLLRSGEWEVIRLVPHRQDEDLSDHIFDVYGRPAGSSANPATSRH